ncbi:uncharacterized protein V3H82_001036 isoform 5-T5 [Fundulus diaphanus]
MFVCSRHFHSGKPAYEFQESDTDWVPSLHLGHTQFKVTTPEAAGVDSISAAIILKDHDYCRSPSDGERSLDCQSPDFVPSEFVYTKENEGPEEKMKRGDVSLYASQQLIMLGPGKTQVPVEAIMIHKKLQVVVQTWCVSGVCGRPRELTPLFSFPQLIALPWMAVLHLDAPIGPRKGSECLAFLKKPTDE